MVLPTTYYNMNDSESNMNMITTANVYFTSYLSPLYLLNNQGYQLIGFGNPSCLQLGEQLLPIQETPRKPPVVPMLVLAALIRKYPPIRYTILCCLTLWYSQLLLRKGTRSPKMPRPKMAYWRYWRVVEIIFWEGVRGYSEATNRSYGYSKERCFFRGYTWED